MKKANKSWWVLALLLFASGSVSYYIYDNRVIDLHWQVHLIRSAMVSAAVIGIAFFCLRNKSDAAA